MSTVFENVPKRNYSFITTQWVINQEYIDGKITYSKQGWQVGFKKMTSPKKTHQLFRLRVYDFFASYHNDLEMTTQLTFNRAFLQGDVISREVYIKPPKEAEASDFWRRLKCVYGLRDASRL